jgi:hypothetical protein
MKYLPTPYLLSVLPVAQKMALSEVNTDGITGLSKNSNNFNIPTITRDPSKVTRKA